MKPKTVHLGSDYDRVRSRHTFQNDSYLGGDHFRTPSRTTLSSATAWNYSINIDGSSTARAPQRYVTYLVPHTAESDESFSARLQRACYINIVAPIVDTYAEGITANVTRQLPESYGDMTDVDMRGSSWAEHAEEVARWSALYGYVAVVFDTPGNADVSNRADEISKKVQPRAIIVQPTAFAWVDVDDDGCLCTFAYVEQSIRDTTALRAGVASGFNKVRLRVYTLVGGADGMTAEWQLREGTISQSMGVNEQRDQFGVVLDSGPLPAVLEGRLPVEFAYFRRISSSRFPLGQSVADDACDIARSVYCKLSEEDEIHVKAGFPFLAIPMASTGGQMDAETRISIGPGRGLPYDGSTGVPSYVQPSSESSRELRESVVFRVALAFRLAGIEVASDQSGQAESGVALRVRARGFESRAKRFANAMARYEKNGLELWARLAGSSEQAYVEYAKRFTLPDPSEDLANVLSLLRDMPLEIGVDAKVAAARKALDAVLSLPDEEMTKILDEIRGMMVGDAADFMGARAATAAERDVTAATHAVTKAELDKKMATFAAPPEAAPDPAADPHAKDPQAALSGGQVTSLLEIVTQVATRAIPRETGVQLIIAAFPISPDQADTILGPVGETFFAEVPAPTMHGPPQQPPPDSAVKDAPADDTGKPSAGDAAPEVDQRPSKPPPPAE